MRPPPQPAVTTVQVNPAQHDRLFTINLDRDGYHSVTFTHTDGSDTVEVLTHPAYAVVNLAPGGVDLLIQGLLELRRQMAPTRDVASDPAAIAAETVGLFLEFRDQR